MVLRESRAGAPEVLFIERARHPSDPWSGHMAFPGGRLDPSDPTPSHAAERETREEVGLDLGEGERLGRLDDLEGRPSGLLVSAFVYRHPAPRLVLNHEVEAALWLPVRELANPERHVDYEHPTLRGFRSPGIVVGEAEGHVVWGLTYRFVDNFLRLVDQPLPARR
jgi:8-oxo-dGTP pyrophosphatase MutT (NUDIX family)